MSSPSRRPWTGPVRDFVGYGQHPPKVEWPDGAKVVVNIVVNYEEGAEYSVLDGDGFNDTWGEYTYTIPPEIRDIGTESHMEYGSRVGIWRIARMLDSFGIDVSMDCCALALERNPEFCGWIRERNHEIIGHGWRWTEDSRMTRDEERESLEPRDPLDRSRRPVSASSAGSCARSRASTRASSCSRRAASCTTRTPATTSCPTTRSRTASRSSWCRTRRSTTT